MTTPPQQKMPTPDLFLQGANAYQLSAVLKTAVELDVFTAVGEGNSTADRIASRCGASVRGIRILCDYLSVQGFLTKNANGYELTQDSAVFLDRNSPLYLGSAAKFLVHSSFLDTFKNLTEIVRRGAMTHGNDTLSPDDPIWVEFARSLGAMQRLQAESLAMFLSGNPGPLKVLDIAAGHGFFGIAVASQNPQAEITALDWASVLEVAKENALEAGVSGRYRTVAGSAFETDFGGLYDLILVTNFLHHFDPATIGRFLRKAKAAMSPVARLVVVDFIPDENRTEPPIAAAFAMTMLGTTPAGDAYTFSEYKEMFAEAGLSSLEMHSMPPSPQRLLIARV